MAIFWDWQWCLLLGIVFATFGMAKDGKKDRKLLYHFIVGMLITVGLTIGALWLFYEVDAYWMLSYFLVPSEALVSLILIYPIFYIIGFVMVEVLARITYDKYLLLIFTVIWILYTAFTFDRFYYLSVTGEWFWEVSLIVDNFLWIPIPAGLWLGPLFMGFFIGSFLLFAIFLVISIYFILAKHNCTNPDVSKRGNLCYVE